MSGGWKKGLLIIAVAISIVFSSQVSWSKQVIKLATIAPEGSTFMKTFHMLEQEIKQKTNGEVEFKVYTGGVMGNDADLLRKMRIGQIHGAAFTAGGASAVYPDLRTMSVPLIFRNYEEVDYVLSKVTPKFEAELDKRGYTVLTFTEAGFANLMSQYSISGVDDLKGKKVWIPEGDPVGQAVFEEAGVPPIPLPLPDVITSLQTRQLDTVATSPQGALILQWYTKIKYITQEPLLYVYGVVMIDKRTYNKISPQNQKVLKEVFPRYFKNINLSTRKANTDSLETMKKKGIQLVPVTPEKHAGLVKLIDKAKAKLYAKGIFTKETVDLIEKSVQEYRKANPEKGK